MKRKGVSPLIAAVLLIAFTVAISAILAAWVTQFTKTQQDDTLEKQKKIECSGSNFIINNDFTKWTPSEGNISVRFENIGFNDVWIEKIQVWYDNRTLPKYIDFTQFNLPEDKDLLTEFDVYNTQDGILIPSEVGSLKKLQFVSSCEGVWFILDRPVSGWNEQD